MEEPKSPGEGQEEGVMKDQTEQARGECSQITDDARELATDVNCLVEDAADFLRDQAIQRPYVTLMSAFGAGYVLGGGVPPWALRAMLTIGSKMIATAIITQIGKAASPRGVEPETSD